MRTLRRARALVHARSAAETLASALPQLLAQQKLPAAACISAYYPLPDEIDPLPALAALRQLGHDIALPVIQEKEGILRFRRWNDTTPLVASAFGVREPEMGAWLVPDVVLVPLLAFDAACQRLGFGAGHYDRTLVTLRAQTKIFAVGLAFEMQRVERIPTEAHDQPLDCVLTEQHLYWPAPAPVCTLNEQ